MLYADVILPFPLAQTYSYAIPEAMEGTLMVGMRVVVPFGARRFYTGIVCHIDTQAPDCNTIKAITLQLDDSPMVCPEQLRFWQWMATYYRTTLGDIYRMAMPSALKLESETIVELTDIVPTADLSAHEQRICAILTQKPLSIQAINNALDVKNALPAIKKLLTRGMVTLSEEISERYTPRTENFISITEQYIGQPTETLLRLPARAKRQQQLLQAYLTLSPERDLVKKTELLKYANCNSSICTALIERGIFRQTTREVSRLETFTKSAGLVTLTPEQQTAYQAIHQQWQQKNVVLLHGITASGKTEIYTHLISDVLQQGRQVLYLVPEIALTTQLTMRLKGIFGEKLGVYHSKYSDAERVEIWQNLLKQQSRQIIIGTRAALFLPFNNLGLVIVDEEHDASYKQSDTTPHFHARNAALMLAAQFKAKAIIGSATPAVESYCNALNGKFGLVELSTRYTNIAQPTIISVDLTEAYRKKQMTGHFSDLLITKITDTLTDNAQVILFQNRRGFAPYTECRQCGWVPRCPHCDVSLTYHKRFNKLTCHYCGYTQTLPETCPNCQQPTLQMHGFGTEQVENEIAELFPHARIGRMDIDTVRNKNAFARIIEQFGNHEIDILVGTQMIAKGLDFENVGLVGILNADNLLYYPDFRANERAFQLLTQVSGRAGRCHRQGMVVLQTSQPQHPVIQYVKNGNYRAFFDREMAERQQFHYPPYYRLIQITLKHHTPDTLNEAARRLAHTLCNLFGTQRVFGPDNPPVGRIKNMFIKHILLKFEMQLSPEQCKQRIDDTIRALLQRPEYRQLNIVLDIDV
ncbi:MAG: primosomal protein N' [Paludibacteraceae bacterium]